MKKLVRGKSEDKEFFGGHVKIKNDMRSESLCVKIFRSPNSLVRMCASCLSAFFTYRYSVEAEETIFDHYRSFLFEHFAFFKFYRFSEIKSQYVRVF